MPQPPPSHAPTPPTEGGLDNPIQLAFGVVRHRRLRPIERVFSYPAVFLRLRIDGDAAATRARQLGAGFGWGRWAPLSFDPRDHGDGSGALEPWLRALLTEAGLPLEGPIWLHCFPRMLGYSFKPVSFWFCHDRDGVLRAIVAEVNNTFGERHLYVLADPGGRPLPQGGLLRARKAFHVSPFCAVAGDYDFRFMTRGNQTVARIDLHDATGPLLLTSLSGTLSPASPRQIWRAVLSHPTFTLGVILRIHWQALRLWWAGVPWHRKPPPPSHLVSRGQP